MRLYGLGSNDAGWSLGFLASGFYIYNTKNLKFVDAATAERNSGLRWN